MANTQYISPIRLFEHSSVDVDGELNVARIKKQLNAEFEISKSGLIEIEGYAYNKNDVFEEISHANFSHRLIYHKQLWSSKGILNWLERNNVNLTEVDQEFNRFYNNKSFDSFFSPYFAGPFNYTARSLINNLELEKLGHLLAYEDFLQPSDREDAFKSIRIFLDENLRILKNLSAQNYGVMRPQIAHWIDIEWHGFLNNLPDEFYDDKMEIAVQLINVTARIQKWYEDDCKSISSKLILLNDLPEDLSDLIAKNHTIFFRSRVSEASDYRWLIWVVIILLKLIAFNGC